MMAAQLIAAHNAAMECYRRAMIGEQTLEGHRENLTQANKLSRTYAVLLDALNRHRGKGQQKVTVEHVHVHAGGQAVVGMVGAPGGGDQPKFEGQPHAKQIAHAPQPAMRSADKEREPVPVAGDAELVTRRAWPASIRTGSLQAGPHGLDGGQAQFGEQELDAGGIDGIGRLHARPPSSARTAAGW
jgi:hypothetical protein